MSEACWLKGCDPGSMLTALYRRGTVRKLRLFKVACCRRIESILKVRERVLLEQALRRADDMIGDEDLPREFTGKGAAAFAVFFAAEAIDPYYNSWALLEKQCRAARACAENAIEALADAGTVQRGDERLAQAQLLRDIFGNPFRPAAADPDWLAWRERTVVRLAEEAYGRPGADGLLDLGQLAILADALEEAGCTSRDMLAHLRTPGKAHVRGCWVVDLLLAKK